MIREHSALHCPPDCRNPLLSPQIQSLFELANLPAAFASLRDQQSKGHHLRVTDRRVPARHERNKHGTLGRLHVDPATQVADRDTSTVCQVAAIGSQRDDPDLGHPTPGIWQAPGAAAAILAADDVATALQGQAQRMVAIVVPCSGVRTWLARLPPRSPSG